ncbi:MAG: gluconate 2-dehydrogenase subunit 3 family protein [Deltaproteobacteria bacterium]|nr:gluconate 2-dehydrogenase subunit 3 family protein [Deltaproteobacteria bacterium]
MSSEPTPFSEEARRTLATVLDEILPARPDGRLSGAGALGLGSRLEEALKKEPLQHAMVAQGLADVEKAARVRHGASLAEVPASERRALLEEQPFTGLVMFHAYVGYYQDERVVAVLGIEPRPPHPLGYEMPPNDLTLLDPVRRRAKMYRG